MMVKTGRPTKYDSKYEEMLIEHMAEGYSFESFAGLIGVCYDTLYEWCKVNDAFSEAKKQGRAKQFLKDEQTLKGLTTGKVTGSAAAHIFKMKNVHKWVDRVESESVNTNKNVEISYEDYIKTLGDN
jgi:hypothetical protein